MNPNQIHDLNHSHLFLVRVWSEQDNEGQTDWRGKLQHVVSGEAHYFDGWPTLIDLLLAMLQVEEKGEEMRVDNN